MIDIRKKGYRAERDIVKKLNHFGFSSHRNLCSGAIEGFKGDIVFKFGSWKFCIESKHYKSMAIFRIWDKHKQSVRGQIPLLALKEDNNDTLICMHIDEFAQLMELLNESNEVKNDTATGIMLKRDKAGLEIIDELERMIKRYKSNLRL